MLSLIQEEFGITSKKIVCLPRVFSDDGRNDQKKTEERCEIHNTLSDLEGNPLAVDEIANLSTESQRSDTDLETFKYNSRYFDFNGLQPITKWIISFNYVFRKPDGGYLDSTLYYVSNNSDQFFSLFPTEIMTSKRILRINTIFGVFLFF